MTLSEVIIAEAKKFYSGCKRDYIFKFYEVRILKHSKTNFEKEVRIFNLKKIIYPS